MTEQSGISRRQALTYGGLAAALPLLPSMRSAGKASPGGGHSLPRQVMPAQLAQTAGGAAYVRVSRAGRRGVRRMRCQLQFPAIRDRVILGGES